MSHFMYSSWLRWYILCGFVSFVRLAAHIFFSVSPWCFLQNDVRGINLTCRTNSSAKMINKEASKQPKSAQQVMKWCLWCVMINELMQFLWHVNTWRGTVIWGASSYTRKDYSRTLKMLLHQIGLVWFDGYFHTAVTANRMECQRFEGKM